MDGAALAARLLEEVRQEVAELGHVGLATVATMLLVPTLQAQAGSNAAQVACTAPAWAEG